MFSDVPIGTEAVRTWKRLGKMDLIEIDRLSPVDISEELIFKKELV